MNLYLVDFIDDTPAFLCWAENQFHALEQAMNAYPESAPVRVCLVSWVWGEDLPDYD